MEKQFVTIRGEKVYVDEEGCLDLRGSGISDMDEIIGLESLVGLKGLRLGNRDDKKQPLTPRNEIKVFKVMKSFISLEILDIRDTPLAKLPESIGKLKNLQTLDLRWCEALTTLPESIGELTNLQTLDVSSCFVLTTLPESIGKLKNLQTLDLSECKALNKLPESIGELEKLSILILRDCNFREIPPVLHSLKNLKKLDLDGNPLTDEEREMMRNTLKVIKDYLKKKAAIRVFLGHAVLDYEVFRIKNIAEFLEAQKEVYKAYYCERDMQGNIDEFMNMVIPQCQLMLFFASHKSVFDSSDCRRELQLARQHGIRVKPIKGRDVEWKDLAGIQLSREIGLEFEEEDFEGFLVQLYEKIQAFKWNSLKN